MKQSKSNIIAVLSIVLLIAWVALALADMWLNIVSLVVFLKITVSLFVVLLLLAFIGFYQSDKK